MNADLIAELQLFTATAPLELLEGICVALETSPSWSAFQNSGFLGILPPELRQSCARIVTCAQSEGRLPAELAFGFRAACAVEARHRKEPRIELVWSGPVFQPFSLRRTDETLLQLIQSATGRLTLVSFALYKISRLSNALADAARRDVRIRLFGEPAHGAERGMKSLYGDFLASQIEFYTWSDDERLTSEKGNPGVLHAKAAVADERQLLVSSANLTEYAMTLNIELGLLVTGGDLPGRVEHMFDDYVERGVFVRHSNISG